MPVENLTIQWSISSEALDRNHHAFGGTWGGKGCSFHHNLFACNTGRNPSIGMGGLFDFRNNVLFNWRHRTIDGGDGSSRVNIVANYFKPGPATTEENLRRRICKIDTRRAQYEFPGVGKWYVDGNVLEGSPEITADNWAGVHYSEAQEIKGEIVPRATEEDARALEPFPAASVGQQSAGEAYELVLAHAGASLPRRDAVDLRVIESVRNGRPTFPMGSSIPRPMWAAGPCTNRPRSPPTPTPTACRTIGRRVTASTRRTRRIPRATATATAIRPSRST